ILTAMESLPVERSELTETAAWASSAPPALRLARRKGRAFIELTAPTLEGRLYFGKRAIDVVGAVLGLIVLSPLFAVIAALIRLESPGSVIFSQWRAGQGGRAFRLLKFRTMRHGAD